jgi:hypothetical protein
MTEVPGNGRRRRHDDVFTDHFVVDIALAGTRESMTEGTLTRFAILIHSNR